MTRSIELRTKKYVKGYGFLSFARKYSTNMGKNYWIQLQKQIRCCKSCFQKVIYKTAETTGELMGKRIAEKIVDPKPVYDESSRNVDEIIIPSEKR